MEGQVTVRSAADAVADARRDAARAMAALAAASVRYADVRTATDPAGADPRDASGSQRYRPKPGEFVADELSLLLREQPYQVRCLVARTRRVTTGLPTVWDAYTAGDLDAEQVRVIDRVARRVTEHPTLHAIDTQVVTVAGTRTPKQLTTWLLRLVIALEPLAFAHRHRRALADRRVTVHQGVDGIGYVTGEMSAADAAAIDARLAVAARSLGADDPRTHQQRRADLLTDLILGRLHLLDDELIDDDESEQTGEQTDTAEPTSWVEVEDIDPDTGELLGTRRQPLDPDGHPIDQKIGETQPAGRPVLRPVRLPTGPTRIGIVVPLSSLLGVTEAPGELADRSSFVPGDTLRDLIADTIGHQPVLFTRLLTDDGGRLLDTTELGRHASRRLAEAIHLRAGSCRFPTCTVPAHLCDLDHHQPHPSGPTAGHNQDPDCRRHHRGKTFAWLATIRDHDHVEWTMPDAHRYRCVDDPLPTGALPNRVADASVRVSRGSRVRATAERSRGTPRRC